MDDKSGPGEPEKPLDPQMAEAYRDVRRRANRILIYALALLAGVFGSTMIAGVYTREIGELFCPPVAILAFLAHWLVWRCPACRKPLFGQSNPRFCSRCRVRFR